MITQRKVENRANKAWKRKNATNSIWWWVFRATNWAIKERHKEWFLRDLQFIIHSWVLPQVNSHYHVSLIRFFLTGFFRCWTCIRKNKMIKVIALFQKITCLILPRKESLYQLNYQQNQYILFPPLRFSLRYKNINTWYFESSLICFPASGELLRSLSSPAISLNIVLGGNKIETFSLLNILTITPASLSWVVSMHWLEK